MKKALCLEHAFENLPLFDRFAKAREAGFGHVELGGWTELDLSMVTEQLDSNSLALSCISGLNRFSPSDPERREAFLEFLSQSLAVAKSFSCPAIVVASEAKLHEQAGFGLDRKKDFAGVSTTIRTLMDAADQAEKSGVTLLVTPLPDTMESESASLRGIPSAGDVVRVVNSPALRLLYRLDTCGMSQTELADNMRKYRDVTGYVRIGEGVVLSSGKRGVDLPSVRKALADELRYDGIVGFAAGGGNREEECIEMIQTC